MAVVRSGETEQDRELAKWNKPYVYAPFPRMIYRGVLRSDGVHDFESRIVDGERQLHEAKSEGWVESPNDAKAVVNAQEAAIAEAAAENAYAAQKMSAKARKELAMREAATHKHVAE